MGTGAHRSTSHPFAETCSRPASRNSVGMRVPPQGPMRSRAALFRLLPKPRETVVGEWMELHDGGVEFLYGDGGSGFDAPKSRGHAPEFGDSQILRDIGAPVSHKIRWEKAARVHRRRAVALRAKHRTDHRLIEATFSGARFSAITDPYGPTSFKATAKIAAAALTSRTASPARMPT